VQVYRRLEAKLSLVTTLLKTDHLTSPLLPNFGCSVAEIFS